MDLDALIRGLFDTLGRLLLREVREEIDVQIVTELMQNGFVCHVVLPCLGGISYEGKAATTEEEAQIHVLQLCLESFSTAGQSASWAMTTAMKSPFQLAASRPRPPKTPPWTGPDVVTIDDGPAEVPKALPLGRQASWMAPKAKAAPKVKAMPKVAKAKAWPGPPMPPTTPPPAWEQAQVAQGGAEPKVFLHTLLTKITGQSPTKADVEYNCSMLAEGHHQCILILNSLEGRGFAGYACATKKDAEQSAAGVAIEWIQEHALGGAPTPRKRKQQAPAMMALPVDAEAQPPTKKAKNGNQIIRSMSSASIGSQEGLDFCAEWRDTRLEPCAFEDIQEPGSIEFYFGQACLSCQAIVSIKGWDSHASGKKHLQRLEAQPMKLRTGIERPLPAPTLDLLDAALFVETGGWGIPDGLGDYPTVLTLGEMDFSFSRAVAELRPPGALLVATSYLAEHDPSEVEVYPSDDGERATYKRNSLPGMKGALKQNLEALADLDAQVFHSVDATDLAGTLLTQGVQGGFHTVVFPFPRFSLSRAPNPNNSRLLRDFFQSVMRDGVLLEGGNIQLVMLSAQYEEWDVNGMASDMGLVLMSRVALPTDFYQAREMSGKPWTPPGAELLTFQVAG